MVQFHHTTILDPDVLRNTALYVSLLHAYACQTHQLKSYNNVPPDPAYDDDAYMQARCCTFHCVGAPAAKLKVHATLLLNLFFSICPIT